MTSAPPVNRPLPKGWRWVRLGEVCSLARATIEPTDALAPALPYVGLENIESNSGRISLNESTQVQGLSFTFNENHVLYGKLRPYLNKVALPVFSGRCSTEIIPLLPNRDVDREYLAWRLRLPSSVDFAMKGKTGSRMPRADMKDFINLPIPLPSLDEQCRIVARLNEQMAVAERTRRAADRMAEAAHALPSALLREIFPLNGENLPQRWRWVRLGDICNIVIGKTPSRNNPTAWGGSHVWVKISDMANDPVTQTSETLSNEGSNACSGRLLSKGTLLYSFKLTIGKTAFAGVDLFTNEAIAGLIPKHPENLSMPFLQYALSTADTSRLTGNAVKGKTLNKRSLAVLPVPLPPFEEQQHIVTRTKAQMAAAERVRREAEAQAEDAAAMAGTLLHDAFHAVL